VENTGDRTASSFLVIVSLHAGQGQPEEAQFNMDFLAGGATASGVVTFHAKPTPENISVRVSYVEP
jgi:uncharacterized protein (TIGR02588 family)